MKVSAIAAALAAAGLLATDAKPETITAELNKLLAADKKARDEAKEAEEKKAAADKAAKDAEKDGADDPEGVDEDPEVEDEFPEKPEGGAEKPAKTNVKDGKRGKDKAMDSASVATLIAANDAKHAAAREVESILGVVSFDSADKYYKAALDKLGRHGRRSRLRVPRIAQDCEGQRDGGIGLDRRRRRCGHGHGDRHQGLRPASLRVVVQSVSIFRNRTHVRFSKESEFGTGSGRCRRFRQHEPLLVCPRGSGRACRAGRRSESREFRVGQSRRLERPAGLQFRVSNRLFGPQ